MSNFYIRCFVVASDFILSSSLLINVKNVYVSCIYIYEKQLSEQHDVRFVLFCWGGGGGIYLLQERFEEAEPLFFKAIAIYESVFGDKHPFAEAARENLATTSARQVCPYQIADKQNLLQNSTEGMTV